MLTQISDMLSFSAAIKQDDGQCAHVTVSRRCERSEAIQALYYSVGLLRR
jgi:hypothetical protein